MQLKAISKLVAMIAMVVSFQTLSLTPAAAVLSCSATIDDLDFGVVDLTIAGVKRTTGFWRITCTGGIPNERVRLCSHIEEGTGGIDPSGDPRYMLAGANQLKFNLFKNNSYSTVWGSRLWGLPPTQKGQRRRLNGAGNLTRNVRIRAQIEAGQAGVPNGTYVSNFTGTFSRMTYAYASVGGCGAVGTMNIFNVPFLVRAEYLPSCAVSAGNLNFRTVGAIGSNIDATNSIDINCTVGTPYSVSLDNGSSGGAGPLSRLMAAAGNTVTYQIFQNAARSIAWGDLIGTNTISGTGTGVVQNLTGYGRVPVQVTPIPGTYTDTVIVTVTY